MRETYARRVQHRSERERYTRGAHSIGVREIYTLGVYSLGESERDIRGAFYDKSEIYIYIYDTRTAWARVRGRYSKRATLRGRERDIHDARDRGR